MGSLALGLWEVLSLLRPGSVLYASVAAGGS